MPRHLSSCSDINAVLLAYAARQCSAFPPRFRYMRPWFGCSRSVRRPTLRCDRTLVPLLSLLQEFRRNYPPTRNGSRSYERRLCARSLLEPRSTTPATPLPHSPFRPAQRRSHSHAVTLRPTRDGVGGVSQPEEATPPLCVQVQRESSVDADVHALKNTVRCRFHTASV